MKKYDMKRYFVAAALLLGLVASSCQKAAEFERPLGLLSRLTSLESSAGDTPVLVFSNTDWTASLTSKVKWAGLDRLSGSGCSQVHFQYGENYGRARKVGIAFEAAGGMRDTVFMVQAAGQTDPVLEFVTSSETVSAEGGEGKYALNCDLVYDIADVKAEVRYHEGEGWIEVGEISLSQVSITSLPNSGSSARSADIVLTHTDGNGEKISSWITLTQASK